jgi:hypothetical protein
MKVDPDCKSKGEVSMRLGRNSLLCREPIDERIVGQGAERQDGPPVMNGLRARFF